MFNDILVPTDGAEGFEEVVEKASGIAKEFDSSIHAVNVVDTRVFVDSVDAGYVLEGLEEFGEEKTQEVKEIAKKKRVPVLEDVREGIPHKEIIDYAEEKDVDLIVMGTHGRSGIGRLVMGSVAEKVIRKSDVPVMTVDLGEEEESE